jgi:hypothetical protein
LLFVDAKKFASWVFCYSVAVAIKNVVDVASEFVILLDLVLVHDIAAVAALDVGHFHFPDDHLELAGYVEKGPVLFVVVHVAAALVLDFVPVAHDHANVVLDVEHLTCADIHQFELVQSVAAVVVEFVVHFAAVPNTDFAAVAHDHAGIHFVELRLLYLVSTVATALVVELIVVLYANFWRKIPLA